MRPLELTLEGFTSFRQRAQIDFSKLELFAITGQTGAGKSSLLDAMTLALYGKVARFGGRTQPKELLSQGSLRLQVTLRFSVDNIEYQVSRSWLYRSKTAQAIFKLDRRVNGEWESVGEQKDADISASIEHILRMDFDTFTKVILLPQGKFDEFLKGKGSERREILRELVGHAIFDRMRETARERDGLLKGECNALQSQLSTLNLSSVEEVNQKRNQYTKLANEIPLLIQAVEAAKTTLRTEQELLKRLKHLADLQQQFAQLNQQATNIATLTQQLQLARVCDRLSSTWTSVNSSSRRYQKAKLAIETATQDLIQAQADAKVQQDNLSTVLAERDEIKPQLEQQEQALSAAKIYEDQRCQIQVEVKRTKSILTQKEEDVAKCQKSAQSEEKKLIEQRDILTKAATELSQYSPGGTRLEDLSQVAPLLIQWSEKAKQVASDRTQFQNITQQLEISAQACETAVLDWEKTSTEFIHIQEQLTTARQQNGAAALRTLLRDGDNCPVCGGVYSEVHLPESSHDIKVLEKRYNAADKKRQQAADTKTKVETKQENLKLQATESSQVLVDKEAELANLANQISIILATETWELQTLKNEEQKLKISDVKYSEALKKQQKADAEVKNGELNFNFAQQKLVEARSQQENAATEVKRQETKLQEISDTLAQLTNGQSYQILSQKLEQAKQDLENRVNQANKSAQAARDELTKAIEKDAKAKEDFETAANEKKQLETQWQTQLQAEKLTEQTFKISQSSPENQSQWQQKIDTYNQKKLKLETLMQPATEEIAGRTTNQETITNLETAVNIAQQQHQQIQDEYNNLKMWIAAAEHDQQQAQELQAQLSTKEQDQQTYHTLARELQSDRFQAYLLQNFEQELVTQATVILRELTDRRYALKYENKEYYVEDNWNGGEIRRVQTLSGGETFAASLSLALALSEKLSGGTKLGSLFIDEGFGTLDTETLESVCNILQSLGQDRLVGVITHVPALGEQLGKQIRVEKFPEGSRIQERF